MQAYESCSDKKSAELLLQDVLVRQSTVLIEIYRSLWLGGVIDHNMVMEYLTRNVFFVLFPDQERGGCGIFYQAIWTSPVQESSRYDDLQGPQADTLLKNTSKTDSSYHQGSSKSTTTFLSFLFELSIIYLCLNLFV